jgi:hypothetical protein
MRPREYTRGNESLGLVEGLDQFVLQ